VVLGFAGEEFGYELQIGLPALNEHALGTLFTLDPLWHASVLAIAIGSGALLGRLAEHFRRLA